MILPIYAYGHPVLKKIGVDITPEYPELKTLIENMWETMYHADGIGLAAPQIGLAIRMFVLDTTHIERETEIETDKPLKQIFLNAQILVEDGNKWAFEEGCLSIPRIRGNVERHPNIKIKYQDGDFKSHEEIFTGINARVIQHEYDHIEGKLFTEYLSPLKRRLIQKKLDAIKSGSIQTDYRMRFAQ
jgi:peptide deformylase